MKTYGYLTNWNSSGYLDLIHLVCKYSVKVFSKSAVLSSEIMIKYYKSFDINTIFLVDNDT